MLFVPSSSPVKQGFLVIFLFEMGKPVPILIRAFTHKGGKNIRISNFFTSKIFFQSDNTKDKSSLQFQVFKTRKDSFPNIVLCLRYSMGQDKFWGSLFITEQKEPTHPLPYHFEYFLSVSTYLWPYMQKAGDTWDISPQIFLDFPQNFRLRTRNQYCTQAIAWGSTI